MHDPVVDLHGAEEGEELTWTFLASLFRLFFSLPEQNNAAVKDVESVADVAEEPVSHQLEDHLNHEYEAEGQVADLDRSGEEFGLIVKLDAHAEGVDEDAKQDESLEDIVVDEGLESFLALGQTDTDTA